MIRDAIGRMSLLTRFTLVSLIITILLAAGLAWGLESLLKNDTLWNQAENTAYQVTNVLDKNLDSGDMNEALTGDRFHQIDNLVRQSLFSSHVVRIKIWNRDGLLIYSDDQSIIGQRFPISEELQKALNGQMATDISTLNKPENASERDQFTQLFEIYVPLQPSDSDHVLGAYEVYYDFNVLQKRLDRLRNSVWGGVGAGFLILYGALFLLVRNASRELIRRNEENQRLLIAEQKQRQLSETLGRVGLALSEILDLRKLLDLICRESVSVFHAQAAFLALIQGEELVGFAAYGTGAEKFVQMRYSLSQSGVLATRVIREKRPEFINQAAGSDQVDQELIRLFHVESLLGAPLIKGDHIFGLLMILDTQYSTRFSPADLETASIFSSYAAIAIDNAQLYEDTQLHLRHEQSLHEIDRAISSSLNLEFTLEVVLRQVMEQLHTDACDILLFDPYSQTLGYSKGLGFKSRLIEATHFLIGDGYLGQSVLEQKPIILPRLEINPFGSNRNGLIETEGFHAYCMVPLGAKGRILGVLEVFQRAPLEISGDWRDFLETLAGQTAIAIDNASLFNNLQRSNIELGMAYDATIEGWALALELRDKETEGHTRRVTQMTVALARRMGIPEEHLIHIRRGALLHDIGKMAIPDAILLKPQPLTDDEWAVMRQHPQFAYTMLMRISYLHEALEIPYCHHEKWDGSGYPRGLQGEEIPLSARIFSVSDVFDALTSDRPYRKAWPEEVVLRYIHEQMGKQFDPQVASLFLKNHSEFTGS